MGKQIREGGDGVRGDCKAECTKERIHRKLCKRKVEGGGIGEIPNIKERQGTGALLQQRTPFMCICSAILEFGHVGAVGLFKSGERV